jgi:hypothetical protein
MIKCEHETVVWKCKKCGAYVINHLAVVAAIGKGALDLL